MDHQPKILAICAEPGRCQELENRLDHAGYAIRTAVQAEAGLSILRQSPVDLVIADYRVTGMQDQQFQRMIRELCPTVRILVLAPAAQVAEFQTQTSSRLLFFLDETMEDRLLERYVERLVQPADTTQNRRQFNRYMLAIDTHCILINPFDNSEGRPIAGLIRDVSRSGLSMLVRRLLPVPTMLKLLVELPNSRKSVQMLAKSLSCTLTQIPDVYRLGAKFVGLLPPEMAEAIESMELEGRTAADADIFLGKSFRNALEEWLKHHQEVLDPSPSAHQPSLLQLAQEVASTPGDFEL